MTANTAAWQPAFPWQRPPLFNLGEIYATPGAMAFPSGKRPDTYEFLRRHHTGDWGDSRSRGCGGQSPAALHYGSDCRPSYEIGNQKLWIITEADRSTTTVLLPEEYSTMGTHRTKWESTNSPPPRNKHCVMAAVIRRIAEEMPISVPAVKLEGITTATSAYTAHRHHRFTARPASAEQFKAGSGSQKANRELLMEWLSALVRSIDFRESITARNAASLPDKVE